MQSIDKVSDIIIKNITYINGEIESAGWLGEMVMSYMNFHPNRAQISLGKNLASTFKEISKLIYKVPNFVAGYGVKEDEAAKIAADLQTTNDVPIFTRYDYPALSAFVTEKTMKFFEIKKKNKKYRLNNDYFLELTAAATKEVPLQNKIIPIYVDLCILRDGHTAIELKSTADEDVSGARQTLIEQIMIPFIIMPEKRQVFLGIISNNKGWKKNGEWCGHLGSWLSSENILIEDDLWSVLAPTDVSFEEFKEKVQVRFKELLSK